MTTYVYRFAEGNKDMKDLLGGKGANLCEVTNLGLPVPPGFVITTEACRYFFAQASEPAELAGQVAAQLAALETQAGQRFGDAANPLLLSVRSGSKFSMPGMMETILNTGLTDHTISGLAARGGEDFAWDCYRGLIYMFGRTACGITDFPQIDPDANPREQALKFKQLFSEHMGHEFPQDPART